MMTIASSVTPLLLLLFVVAAVAPAANAFCSPAVFAAGAFSSSTTPLQSKKNHKGAPITVQEDEDAAMWIEEKKGERKKALKNPVGGRPINKITKDMVGSAKKKKLWWQP